MHKRGMKWFFGVINLVEDVFNKVDGEFENDGIVLKISSDSIRYSFVHDTSLSYPQSRATLESYLPSIASIPIDDGVSVTHYTFKHLSRRGATVVFCVYKDDRFHPTGTSFHTGHNMSKYTISIPDLLDEPIETDRELFDRMVLMAASSRRIDDYNILSLYKYAKSLRVRTSINSVVLSEGYNKDTKTIVYLTIAAQATASAWHIESGEYFKKATSQIDWLRGGPVSKQVYDISASAGSRIVSVIATASGAGDMLKSLRLKLKSKVIQNNTVSVSVGTIKEFGNRFVPKILGPLFSQAGNPNYNEWFSGPIVTGSVFSPDWNQLEATVAYGVDKPSRHDRWVLASFGVSHTYPADLRIQRFTSRLKPILDPDTKLSGPALMKAAHSSVVLDLGLAHMSDLEPRSLKNGDVVYHVLHEESGPGVSGALEHKFVVVRGAGTHYVLCDVPKYYTSSKCIAFVLLVAEDLTSAVTTAVAGGDIEHLRNPSYSICKQVAADLADEGVTHGVVYSSGASVITRMGATAGTGPVGGRQVHFRHDPRSQAAIDILELASDSDQSELSDEGPATVSLGEAPSSADPETPSVSEGPVLLAQPKFIGAATDPGVYSETVATLPHFASSLPARTAFRHASSGVGTSLGDRADDGDERRSSEEELFEDEEAAGAPPPTSLESDNIDRFKYELAVGFSGSGTKWRDWASVSSEMELPPGFEAVSEMVRWCDETKNAALAIGRDNMDFARAAVEGSLSKRQWNGINAGKEGNVVLCSVIDGQVVDYFDKSPIGHMAVTDGKRVLLRKDAVTEGDVFVTFRELEIWVADALRDRIVETMLGDYKCPVELVEGPAGCGKTTRIVKAMTNNDFGLCETRAAAKDTVERLKRKDPALAERFLTVDSFLINARYVSLGPVDTVYIDEALRLHAAKIWTIMKLLKPNRIVCFGDPEQIPLLPFTPGFDFEHHAFPWTSRSLITETWRLPGDVTALLCESKYYSYHFKTHNQVRYGVRPSVQFAPGLFKDKPYEVTVLTYTKAARDDLRLEGIAPVMTIGESQGKDLDHVWLYRDVTLGKELYYNRAQTLTALTRVKKSFTYVSVDPHDDSAMAKLIEQLGDRVFHSKIESYVIDHTPPVPLVAGT